MSGFRGPLLEGSTDVFILHDVEPRTINNDIRRFFKHELSKLAQRRGGIKVGQQMNSSTPVSKGGRFLRICCCNSQFPQPQVSRSLGPA
jgi:hypothetical protein